MELKARDQRKGETLGQYSTAVTKLVKKAYPDAQGPTFNHLALSTFVEGIMDSQVRTQLRVSNPTTMDEALERANLLSDGREAEKQRARRVVLDEASAPAEAQPPPARQVSSVETPVTQGQLKELTELVRELKDTPKPNQGGHKQSGGQGKWREGQGRGRQDGQRRPRNPNITCWLCDEQGHMSRECPLKRSIQQQVAAAQAAPPLMEQTPSLQGNGAGQL
jgi:hypothetical protein